MVKLHDGVSDDQAILLSDIFPTAYFGACLAEIAPGNTVAVFGCGPVGQLCILSAQLFSAGRIFAIDKEPSRLALARAQGAETIDFNREDPVALLKELTGGIGVDRAIDAVGVDAEAPSDGPAARATKKLQNEFKLELSFVAPRQNPHGNNWHPGGAPSQVLRWAVEGLAKAGTLSIIGVYPQTAMVFPIGMAMNRNLTIKMGNCNHRRYLPELLRLVASGAADPAKILTQREPLGSVIEAYKSFDTRQPGWIKVDLLPQPR